jgi:DNA-binding protein Fis
VPAIPSFHEDRILKAAPVVTSPLLQKPFRLEQTFGCSHRGDVMKEVLESLVAEMLGHNVCLDKALEEFEKQFLQTALRRSGGNQSKAAQLLHIHRNTLARKIVHTKLKAKAPPFEWYATDRAFLSISRNSRTTGSVKFSVAYHDGSFSVSGRPAVTRSEPQAEIDLTRHRASRHL